MITTQLALIKREFWEHRSLYAVPAILALLVTLGAITGQVAISSIGGEHVDLAILGASNLGETELSAVITILLLGMSWVFVMTMGILAIFYALDCLYAERRDKSILFWRSLPITDAETVVSKLVTAIVAIPTVTIAAIAVTHVVVLTIWSIWLGMRGADSLAMIWSAAPLFDNWSATFVVLVALSIWVAPFVGWFLFVSAFTKRSPFLMAFLPLFVLPMLEGIIFRTSVFAGMLYERAPFQAPIFADISSANFEMTEDEILDLAREGVSLLSLVDVGRFLGSPSVWLGVVVCGLFCTAAIYVRRYRDES